MPIDNNNPLAKGMNSVSLRDSINAHCYMCMGGGIEDLRTRNSVVNDIRYCQSSICPLRGVRPFTLPNTGGNES